MLCKMWGLVGLCIAFISFLFLIYFVLLFYFTEAISRQDLSKFVLVLKKGNFDWLSVSPILILHSNII